MKTHPSSVGSRADLGAGVDIAAVHGGYFSDPGVAQSFVDIGLEDLETSLTPHVRFADYGGGEGFLTKIVVDWLVPRGHTVEATVVDSNQGYLKVPKMNGLETMHSNIEDCEVSGLNMIIMRAVNHYNTPKQQSAILQNAYQSLEEKGVLISQVSSGTEENCRLRSDIVNLESLSCTSGGEGYHWTSIAEYCELLVGVGFCDIEVAGYAPSGHWTPEEQWERFHQNHDDESDETRIWFLKEAYSLIESRVEEFGAAHLGVEYGDEGLAEITYQYPIITARKPAGS